MATIEIIGWRENNIGYTGWDNHAKSELTKRLRRAINISPSQIKILVKEILEKHFVILHGVRESDVESVQQILDTIGAEMRVSPTSE